MLQKRRKARTGSVWLPLAETMLQREAQVQTKAANAAQ